MTPEEREAKRVNDQEHARKLWAPGGPLRVRAEKRKQLAKKGKR